MTESPELPEGWSERQPFDPLVAATVADFRAHNPAFEKEWAREVRRSADEVCAGIAGRHMAAGNHDPVMVPVQPRYVPVPRGMNTQDVAEVLLEDIRAEVEDRMRKMTGPGGFG